ncbi:selenocysteine lyase/cysteine desulfurase [Saccharothrix ecbatanensis]|uniref:Probable hercynylcysteine sulfoxide lyase n=1 Tax=Saccharothrix ecbatanensis TaxID=1105145 RepID=A0A7W9HN16_9PSEU|nr:aminotransferase class V-fold PLP-dependent enzyme [Saccharothrix ecbatanensis]MBB5805111.1 selenocysteine lyase/cysteine desulfurase [Saccharothrix ecbatanensis]
MTIFLDSAGSSLPPEEVSAEVFAHLRRESEIGGYVAAREREDDLEAGYGVFAELLGAEPDEIAFTDSATRAWLTAFDAVPLAAGDRVLYSEAEYAGTAIPILHRAREVGAIAEAVPSDSSGQIDVGALKEMLDERVKLVSLVHVPTNSGLVNPAREVADAAHDVGALVLLDACQSIGQMPVRADELGVDLISCTGRKWLRGPRGTGALVVRREAARRMRPRLIDLHSAEWVGPHDVRLREDARVYEIWEANIAARLGLIAAARHALAKGLDVIEREVADRAGRLRAGLSALPGVTVRDVGERMAGIVTFTVDGVGAADVRDRLAREGVTVTVSSASSTLLDMTRRGLDEVVRASPHYFVQPEQVDQAVEAVSRCAR